MLEGVLFMYDIVIPARNEEKSILAVLSTVLSQPVNKVITVVNGCTDHTFDLISSVPDSRLHILFFSEPLGIDVPRAIGTLYARHTGSNGIIILDGDMSGNIGPNIQDLLHALDSGIDIALTNCYPYITSRAKLADFVLKSRARLNRALDLFHTLGLATPTHGPHALSAKALDALPSEAFAIPPLTLYYGKKNNLNIQVATSIPHQHLRSPRKERKHARLIGETIMGDCQMSLCLSQGLPPDRTVGKHQLLGFHPERRFDLLQYWEKALKSGLPVYSNHLIFPRCHYLIAQSPDRNNRS